MLILAHRGASAAQPENTLAAFVEAMRLNADGVELDVHLTKDNHIVVIHDETTGRTCDRDLIIGKSLLIDIQNLLINGVHKVPTLNEVLDLIPNHKTINIEIKTIAATEKAVETITNYKKDLKIMVSSFDWNVLEKVRLKNPKIPIGVLFENDFENALAFAKKTNAEYLNPDYKLLNQTNIAQAHSAGIKICCYTVNDDLEKQKMKNLGVEIIISDYV